MKKYLLLKGLFLTLLGGILLFYPAKILNFVVMFFALEGAVSLLYSIFFLVEQPDSNIKKNLIFGAFFQLFLSLLILMFPQIIQIIISIGVIILAIVLGVFGYNLLSIAKLRAQVGLPYASLFTFLGFSLILLAIFIAINSFAMVLTLVVMLGIVLIGIGIGFIIQALRRGKPVIIEPFSEDEE